MPFVDNYDKFRVSAFAILFVGTMMGITNTFATLSGFIGPAVVGALTYRNVSNYFGSASGTITAHLVLILVVLVVGATVFKLA